MEGGDRGGAAFATRRVFIYTWGREQVLGNTNLITNTDLRWKTERNALEEKDTFLRSHQLHRSECNVGGEGEGGRGWERLGSAGAPRSAPPHLAPPHAAPPRPAPPRPACGRRAKRLSRYINYQCSPAGPALSSTSPPLSFRVNIAGAGRPHFLRCGRCGQRWPGI